MNEKTSRTLKKWLTIWGSFLVMLPIGLPWYWGNMSIYSTSYIAVRGQSSTGVHTPWIISFFFLFNAVGLFVAGVLAKYARKRMILLGGVLTFQIGLFLTYFSVNISIAAMSVTLGFISGVGGGIINGMALQYAMSWADSDLGFVTAFVQSGFNAGPVFINPLITMYVNPGNESPDIDVGPTKLFSQRQVLDQVPSFFVTFGLICSICQLFGILVVRDFPVVTLDEKEILLNTNSRILLSEEHSHNPLSATKYEGYKDIKPSMMIKTKAFFTLWLSLMMFDNAMLVLANYYKEYGATCIRDDHFLTFLGTVLTLLTIIAFPVWGYLTDRCGVKKTLISMYSVSSVLCFFVYFTPKLNRWAYLVNIAVLGSFLPPIFSVILIATCKLFGKAHHSTNIGIVASLSLLVNLINPMIFEKILYLGWFYVFCYAGCLTATGLISIILTLPNV